MRHLVIAALVLLSCAHAAPPPGVPRSHRLQSAETVAVSSTCEGLDELGERVTWRPPLWGSGTVLDGEHVLTALHVVDCPTLPTVRVWLDGDERPRRARVVKTDRAGDLALLATLSAEAIPLGAVPPLIGPVPDVSEPVCAASASPRRETSCGYVITVIDAPKADVEDTAQVRRGNSGAGVFDDRGRLVGVVIALRYCPSGDDSESCGRIWTSLARHRGVLP